MLVPQTSERGTPNRQKQLLHVSQRGIALRCSGGCKAGSSPAHNHCCVPCAFAMGQNVEPAAKPASVNALANDSRVGPSSLIDSAGPPTDPVSRISTVTHTFGLRTPARAITAQPAANPTSRAETSTAAVVQGVIFTGPIVRAASSRQHRRGPAPNAS